MMSKRNVAEAISQNDTMDIQVTPASASENPTLQRLMQLYQYDLSEIVGTNIGPEGSYDYPYLDRYWIEPGRTAFLVRVNGNLAGFALVSRYNYLTGEKDAWVMSEFFILRKYRRQGVGAHAARWIFDHFSGTWQVREDLENEAAISFWRKVISHYTHDNYKEYQLEKDSYQGPVQILSSLPSHELINNEITSM